MRILIADDNEINREFLFGVLAGEDYQIEQACDGAEAVEKCRRHRFDAILMDIRMPEVDGIEATRRIRAMETHRKTTIVALTADLQLEQKSRLLERGFNATLTKPVSRETLLAALRSASGTKPDTTSSETVSPSPIDQRAALAAAGGSQALVDKLTGMLAAELSAFLPRLAQAWKEGDYDTMREIAHKLRASGGYCGAKALQRAAASLELAAQRGEPGPTESALDDLRHAAHDFQKHFSGK